MVASPDREAGTLKGAADASMRSGQFQDALPIYSQALDRAQDTQLRSELLANRCLALLKTGQPTAALEDALRCLELRPRWPKAHLRAAQCQEALGDVSAAIASYRRATELDPSLGEVVEKALAALELKGSRSQCRLRLRGGAAVFGMALHPKALTLGALSTQVLTTACGDGLVRLWCSRTGTLLQALPGHSDMVTAVEWSPCGLLLVSGSLDGTARLWELCPAVAVQLASPGVQSARAPVATGARQQRQQGEGWKQGEGWMQGEGHRQGAMEGLLRLRAELKGHTGRVSSLAFSTAAARLPHPAPKAAAEGSAPAAAYGGDGGAAASGAGAAAAQDAASSGSGCERGGGEACSQGASEGSRACADGEAREQSRSYVMFLATGSTDCTARLWSVDGACLQVLKGHVGIITSISLSPCGSLLATASGDTRCKVWDTATGACVHDIAWESGGVNLCGFLPAVPPLAASSVPTGLPKAPRPPLLLTCHIEPRWREGRVLLWDVGLEGEEEEDGTAAGSEGAAQVPRVQEEAPEGPESRTEAVADRGPAGVVGGVEAAHADSTGMAGEGSGADVHRPGDHAGAGWAQGSACDSEILPASDVPSAGAKGRADKRSSSGGRKRVGWVDGKLHAPALTIDGFRGKITSWDACINSEGALLLATACGDGLARLHDVTDGAVPLFELSMECSMHSAVLHDVPAWSTASMQAAVNARNLVRFCPGARLLAVSGGDHRVNIHEVEGGEAVLSLLGHSSSIRALLWAGEGEVVSAGEDGAVNFWRAGAGF